MPKKAPPKNRTNRSIGLFRALGVPTPGRCRASRPLYRRLVDTARARHRARRRAAGARLPPERDLARALNVSRTTVVSAYRELEAQGLVRGYVGRGTFVSAQPDPGSAPFAWRGKIVGVRAAGQRHDGPRSGARGRRSARHLACRRRSRRSTAFPTRRVSAGDRIIVLSSEPMVAWRHGPTEGQCRGSAKRLRHASAVQPDNILVIAGAQQGLDLLAAASSIPATASSSNGRDISVRCTASATPVHGWSAGISAAPISTSSRNLLLRYRPKLMYPNPTHQNPTSLTMPLRARRELLELAERYRVPIVEDDTYRELTLPARRRRRRSTRSTRCTRSSFT